MSKTRRDGTDDGIRELDSDELSRLTSEVLLAFGLPTSATFRDLYTAWECSGNYIRLSKFDFHCADDTVERMLDMLGAKPCGDIYFVSIYCGSEKVALIRQGRLALIKERWTSISGDALIFDSTKTWVIGVNHSGCVGILRVRRKGA